MSDVRGFPPVAAADARLLILGSMPGTASLTAGCYYAHPRNAFWSIMGALLDFSPQLPYAQRLLALQASGIALWDVIAVCHRKGSLDADIVPRSIVANDFPGFFTAHPRITCVCFNGGAAEQAFRRHVRCGQDLPALDYCRLPSTSPAHAALSHDKKLAAWSVILGALKRPEGV
jgi:hypoxanthine-DNA glycosylase